jgi:hypothetical protein
MNRMAFGAIYDVKLPEIELDPLRTGSNANWIYCELDLLVATIIASQAKTSKGNARDEGFGTAKTARVVIIRPPTV